MYKQFQKWAQEYGPIYSIKLGVQTMIVLSDPDAVKELIDRRSASTNDRGPHYIAHDLLGDGQRILQMVRRAQWGAEPSIRTNSSSCSAMDPTGGYHANCTTAC